MNLKNRLMFHHLITDLQRQWKSLANSARPHRLWITCDEVSMNAAVQQIVSTQSNLVVRVTGGHLTPLSPESDAVNWVLDHMPIRDLVICGHSQCSAFPHDPSRRETRPFNHLPHRCVQGAIARMSQLDRSRRLVVEQLEALQKNLRISTAMNSGEVDLTGMFYLRESGTFTLYDEQTDRFIAIPA